MKKRLVALFLVIATLLSTTGAFAAGTPSDPLLNAIGTLPLVKEEVTLTIGLENSSYVLDYENNALTKMIEEQTGINLEFVLYPETDTATKILLQAAANVELPDIICYGIKDSVIRNQLASAGAILPLDEFFDRETGIADQFYADCERNGVDPDYVLNLMRCSDGKIYGMPSYGYNMPNMYNYRAYINQKWLDNLGLKAPTTIDELTEVLIAFRDQDPNGNGIKDEIPMTGAANSKIASHENPMTWLQNLFIYRDHSSRLYLPLSQTGGKVDVAYDKVEYREFLKYVNMLVREGLLDSTAFTQTQKEMRAQLQSDTETIGMMFGSANGFGQNITSWRPLEIPVGYYGVRNYTVDAPLPGGAWAISSTCKHPEIAFLLASLGYDDTIGPGDGFYSKSALASMEWTGSTPKRAKSPCSTSWVFRLL